MENAAVLSPLSVFYSQAPLDLEPKGESILRTLSSMKSAFQDQEAVERILEREDPPLVEVFMASIPPERGNLMVNINLVHAGRVGEEFFMTKGHIHDDPVNATEVYITLSGQGKLLLQTLDGAVEVLDMQPGSMSYIPAPWAHRCINTGQEPLVYLGVFPANTQRDYSFDTRRFRKLVVERDGNVMVVDSPAAG